MTSRGKRTNSFDEVKQSLSELIEPGTIDTMITTHEVALLRDAHSLPVVKLRLTGDFNRPHVLIVKERQGPSAPDIETGKTEPFTPYQSRLDFDEEELEWIQADTLAHFSPAGLANLAMSLLVADE